MGSSYKNTGHQDRALTMSVCLKLGQSSVDMANNQANANIEGVGLHTF